MARNVHFLTAASWDEARLHLTFDPAIPSYTAGRALESLQIHVRDHRMRELPRGDRSLEAHYGSFVFAQSHAEPADARLAAIETSYGSNPSDALIAGREGRVYPLGPDPAPDDVDGRMPAVVVWHDRGRFFLVASTELESPELLRIATSAYPALGTTPAARAP
jgi:hypothetical protein